VNGQQISSKKFTLVDVFETGNMWVQALEIFGAKPRASNNAVI
jgi:hypothetical protein